jgi:hypothetical protein
LRLWARAEEAGIVLCALAVGAACAGVGCSCALAAAALPDFGAFEGKHVEVLVIEAQPGREDAVPAAARPSRRFGTLAGKLRTADDFDAPLPADVQAAVDGEDPR